MKKRDLIIALVVLAAFLALRGRDLMLPFILPFETAFQEAIALHHRVNGLAANHYLSVIATLDGHNFYHTAHPPLLQIIYARLYELVGVHEWVTRCYSLGLWFATALVWRAMLGRQTRDGWMVLPLAFALPIPFLLCTTTNYEPTSIFIVSLLAWLVLVKQARLILVFPVLAVGVLIDWPAYLAVPVLLWMKRRDRLQQPLLVGLLFIEAVAFTLIQAYSADVTGEWTLFAHAPQRANPLALLTPDLWRELFAHLRSLLGRPLLLAVMAILVAWVQSLGEPRDKAEADADPGRQGAAFFGLFALVLLLLAPRLVSRHEVYLLYFVPMIVFAAHQVLTRLAGTGRWIALAAILLLCLSRDYILAQQRNPAYFGMADRLRNANVKTAFASAAIGDWYFYDRIETVHPVSAAAAKWLAESPPDLIHLDLRHPEVGSFASAASDAGKYQDIFQLPGERVALRRELATGLPVYLPAAGFVMAGPGRDCPAGLYIQLAPFYGVNVTGCRVSEYALHQPPGPAGSAATFSLAPAATLEVTPAIIHALPRAHSDGASFLALAAGPGEVRLAYARTLRDPEGPLPRAELSLRGADRLNLAVLPGPRLDPAFDDAYWLEPVVHFDRLNEKERK
jgi:hypothetical protein